MVMQVLKGLFSAVADVKTQDDRTVLVLPDGLRLIFEDGKYVGFATQEPYVG